MTISPGRVWFITGAGRGLGRAFTEAALAEGDTVVATARTPAALDDLAAQTDRLTVLPLDVTDRAAVVATVDKAAILHGRLDVVVNNAGYGLLGAIEEVTEAQARAQLDTNFFGALWVTQAALPHLRAQGGGRIVQISTVGAIGTFPTAGMYNASKWALEGFSEALAQEVADLGIRVMIVEPGSFATDWAGSSMRFAPQLPAYDPLRASLFGLTDDVPDELEAGNAEVPEPDEDTPADPLASGEALPTDPDTPADPQASAEGVPADAARALIDAVNSDDPPLRLLVGADAPEAARIALERRRDDYRRDPRFTWPT